METESGNGKLERKLGTETGNSRQCLYILLLYAMIVEPIDLDILPSLINVNEPILLGKLIKIIQGL